MLSNLNETGNVNTAKYKLLKHQVAGHLFGKYKIGILQTDDGYILKPIQSPPQGKREHDFYKKLFLSNRRDLNEDEINLINFVPIYMGCVLYNNSYYIKMNDVAYGIKEPSVIDFKIGRITHDPEATLEKKIRHIAKYPDSEINGFQIVGMRVYDNKNKSFDHFDKVFGRSLDHKNIIHGMALYYQYHQTPQIRAIKETIKKFEEIKNWFEKQTIYHFYSSSLIVIYEANLEDILNNNHPSNDNDQSTTNNDNNELMIINENNSNLVRIVMADFAHVFPARDQLDTNYLFGINRLIYHLKLLLNSTYKFKDVRTNN